MNIFIEWINKSIWDYIINGPYIPEYVLNGMEKEKQGYDHDQD